MAERTVGVIGGHECETIQLVDDYDGKICRLTCVVRGETFTAESSDFFEALCSIRRNHLEPKGLLPNCYGTSLNVWPSGMARDMGLGRSAYMLVPRGTGRETTYG